MERLVGDHVAAGATLARLDAAEQQSDLLSACASVSAAWAVLLRAQGDFDRQSKLLAQGFGTRRAFDQAEEALRVAQGSLKVARTQLEGAEEALSYTSLVAPAAGVIVPIHAVRARSYDGDA